MALNSRSFSVKMFTLCFTIHIFFFTSPVAAVPEEELESMLEVLRTRGYNLFGNAITTSDVYFEVLAGSSFTVFAPTDSSLFALDMNAMASDYITTLRYHVVPRRLSVMDLRNLPSGSSLSTLVPHHDIQVQRRRASEIVTADGIDVVVPGLFYGRNIAVHGLGGILSFRFQIGLHHGSSPPPPGGGHHHQSPHPPANLYNNQGSTPPVVEHHHDPPPPGKFSGDHDSPEVDHLRTAPPRANLSDHCKSEPPSDEDTDNRTGMSPVPEPASFDLFSPAYSPGMTDSPFNISPEDGLSTESSPVSAVAPSKEPVPSVPKVDDPVTPSPSIDDMREDPGEGWSLMLTSTAAEIPGPFDAETIDCQGKESETLLGHVSVHHSNPLALQQYPMSTRICANT